MFNVEANVQVAYTALEALDQVRDELAREGSISALARVKQDLMVRLEAFGLAKRPTLTCCSRPVLRRGRLPPVGCQPLSTSIPAPGRRGSEITLWHWRLRAGPLAARS